MGSTSHDDHGHDDHGHGHDDHGHDDHAHHGPDPYIVYPSSERVKIARRDGLLLPILVFAGLVLLAVVVVRLAG